MVDTPAPRPLTAEDWRKPLWGLRYGVGLSADLQDEAVRQVVATVEQLQADLAQRTTERDAARDERDEAHALLNFINNNGVLDTRAAQPQEYRPGTCIPDGPADPPPCGEVCATCTVPRADGG